MDIFSVGIEMSLRLAAIETIIGQHNEISSEIMLCGITKIEDLASPRILDKIDFPAELRLEFQQETNGLLAIFDTHKVNARKIRHELRDILGKGGCVRSADNPGIIHRSEDVKNAFNHAAAIAKENNSLITHLGHLLAALIDLENSNITRMLKDSVIDIQGFRKALIENFPFSQATMTSEDIENLIQKGAVEDIAEISIELKNPDEDGKVYRFQQEEIILGRPGGHKLDLDLSPDLAVSRNHAKIFYKNMDWFIEDLNSKSGTFVNGVRISSPQVISNSSQVKLGKTEVIITTSFDGDISSEILVDEVSIPESIDESFRISLLADLVTLSRNATNRSEIFEGVIQIIRRIIPDAERITILANIRDQLLPEKYFPREQAFYSYTLSEQSRKSRKAFVWTRNAEREQRIPESLYSVASAMYVPIIKNNEVLGVLHVDSTTLFDGFPKLDLDTLVIIASTLAHVMWEKPGLDSIPSVFISYSHKSSRIFTNRLKANLRKNGVDVWIDDKLKVADAYWLKQLAIAIQEQSLFIFIVSPKSVNSKNCIQELDLAVDAKKIIIPIMHIKAELPLKLEEQQYIDMTTTKKEETISGNLSKSSARKAYESMRSSMSTVGNDLGWIGD